MGDTVGGVVGGAPLGLAAAAGMLAAVNPCGFALLPAYLSFLIIGDDTPSRGKSIARALAATAAMTAGFAAVFGAFGLLITPIAGQVQRHLPPITIGIGLLLAGLGAWLLAGRSVSYGAVSRYAGCSGAWHGACCWSGSPETGGTCSTT